MLRTLRVVGGLLSMSWVMACGSQQCDVSTGYDYAFTSDDDLVVACDCIGVGSARCYSHLTGDPCTLSGCIPLDDSASLRGQPIPADDLSAMIAICERIGSVDVDTADSGWCEQE